MIAGVLRVSFALVVAFVAWRFARHLPWPRPFRLRFALAHGVMSPALSLVWLLLSHTFESFVVSGRFSISLYRYPEYLFLGGVLYIFVVGSTYGVEGSARAARAEAMAARTQLAALRAQLHPHFLFNALHTVVQLIPTEPERAAEAAELLAGLLRTSVNEQRDEVLLDDEWQFVSRYLAIEQIRFGDRLAVRSEIPPDLLDERVPSFALQTLVENAVRHGASPRVAPTQIVVSAVGGASDLTLYVRNDGDPKVARNGDGSGTGLARLRERLAVLYGGAARLSTRSLEHGGYEAVLVVPTWRERPT